MALPAVPPVQTANPTWILTMSGFGGTANLKSPMLSKSKIRLTQDSCRLQAEEDVIQGGDGDRSNAFAILEGETHTGFPVKAYEGFGVTRR